MVKTNKSEFSKLKKCICSHFFLYFNFKKQKTRKTQKQKTRKTRGFFGWPTLRNTTSLGCCQLTTEARQYCFNCIYPAAKLRTRFKSMGRDVEPSNRNLSGQASSLCCLHSVLSCTGAFIMPATVYILLCLSTDSCLPPYLTHLQLRFLPHKALKSINFQPTYCLVPRSRVSRSQYLIARCTDSLYSFMKRHSADQTPEVRWTTNEKTNNYD